MRIVRPGHSSHTVAQHIAERIADADTFTHADPIGDAHTHTDADSDTDAHEDPEPVGNADDRASGGLSVSRDLPGHGGAGIREDCGAHLR